MGRAGRRVTHRIHLRGFWDVTEPEPGRVRFARRFGRPTSTPEQQLFLAIEAAIPAMNVEINRLVSEPERIRERLRNEALEPGARR